MLSVKQYMLELGQQARLAGRILSKVETRQKDLALLKIAESLTAKVEHLLSENQKDVLAAHANGLDAAAIDRLQLTTARIDAMVQGLKQVAALPDPVGEISNLNYRPSGIQVGQMRVP